MSRWIADMECLTRDVFGLVYGTGARYNQSEHVWKFGNGGYFELAQLETPSDYTKFQGRSFNLLLIDEAGHYSDPMLLDKLRSNLRGPKGMPIRQVMAANPGDSGHGWLAQRFVFKATPWVPFFEEKSQKNWIYCPSTFLDNKFIDQEQYKSQLEAACYSDPELLKAWISGSWAVARGAFFSSVIEENRNAADPWKEMPKKRGYDEWEYYLSHDYGTTAPSVTFICAKSPGIEGPDGRYYPKDSIVLVDELATNEPGSLSKGINYTIQMIAEEIKDLCSHWKIRPQGVCDDACFSKQGHSAGSIADEFRKYGVAWSPAKKGSRDYGWQLMRTMLSNAGKQDVPGLYISRACSYFWQTVPFIGRDPRKITDVDTRSADHAADAARYSLLRVKPTATQSSSSMR